MYAEFARRGLTDELTFIGSGKLGLVRGLDPESKSQRVAYFIETLRKELVKVTESVGAAHPGLITPDDVDIFLGDYEARPLREV